jgi:hypothetical protein
MQFRGEYNEKEKYDRRDHFPVPKTDNLLPKPKSCSFVIKI